MLQSYLVRSPLVHSGVPMPVGSRVRLTEEQAEMHGSAVEPVEPAETVPGMPESEQPNDEQFI